MRAFDGVLLPEDHRVNAFYQALDTPAGKRAVRFADKVIGK